MLTAAPVGGATTSSLTAGQTALFSVILGGLGSLPPKPRKYLPVIVLAIAFAIG